MTPEQKARHQKIFLNSAKALGLIGAEQLLGKGLEGAAERAILFHTYEQMRDAPPVRFLIKDFWQSEAITLLAALAGHDKTWVLIAIAKALLTGEKLFDYFEVLEIAKRVVYLIPEIAMGPAFYRFCTKFGLDEFIKDGRLLISTLSIGRKITLTDPDLLDEKVIKGADVFLDTLPRFRKPGARESDADGNQELADQLFNLQALGARSIGVAQHSPKEFRKARHMDLENIVRGSGDIGAMIATGWGLRRVTDASDGARNLVYVENIKPRDFAPPESFLLRLRPDIDERGLIGMSKAPGECGSMAEEIDAAARLDKKVGKEEWAKGKWVQDNEIGREKLNELVKAEFGKGFGNNMLADLLSKWKKEDQIEGPPDLAALMKAAPGAFINEGVQ
jgi:hypothetical protein